MSVSFSTTHCGLSLSRRDCEVRMGPYLGTAIWNGHGDGGLFYQGRSSEKAWTWDEVRAWFKQG
jgi:hypothetical protein